MRETTFDHSFRNEALLARYLLEIEDAVRALPLPMAATYKDWAARPESYRFAIEAFYQHRILRWLGNAVQADRISTDAPVFLARQLVRPSAFADTPRVKRVDQVAFVLYPQAATYWLYELSALITLEIDGTQARNDTIAEFLYCTLARRAYARTASPLTAFGIDFVLDGIVLNGRDMAPAHPVTERAAKLAQGVEDFLVNHELAHVMHDHGPATLMETEAAADKSAIELMLFAGAGDRSGKQEQTVAAFDWPFEAYAMLQMWGLFRAVADRRMLIYTAETDEELELQRAAADRQHAERLARLQAMDSFFQFPVPSGARTLCDAGTRVIKRLAQVDLDRAEAERIVRLARSFALRDYHVLRAEALGTAARFHEGGS